MATLNWIGKEAVVNHDKAVPFKLLKKIKSASVGTSQNLIVHGDNLEALKALMPYYVGKIKCIYIDPPYNTGNTGWIYNDKVNSPKIRDWLEKTVKADDLTRHDKWLCMMYPRLAMLRDLLADDGVIFISIGDDEAANLNSIMSEVFGQSNHVATFVWKSRAKPTNAGNAIYRPQKVAEYVFAYSKKAPESIFFNVDSIQKRTYPNTDKNGKYRVTTILTSNRGTFRRDTMRFEINGFKPNEDQRWKAGFVEIQNLFKTDRVGFSDDGIPFRKHYEQDEGEMLYPLYTFMDEALTGTAENGKSELNALIGNKHGFDTIKPVGLIKYFVAITTNPGDIVLDSFAGSGTTAQAVLELNNDAKGQEPRRFVLVEMEDYAQKITAERVKRAIEKYDYKGGFEYCELDKPLFDENGQIEDSCDFKQFATYIYFTETQTNIDAKKIKGNFIGALGETEYYLLYKGKLQNDLDKSALKIISDTDKRKVIYADRCLLDEDELTRYNITFKQIPYEVKVY